MNNMENSIQTLFDKLWNAPKDKFTWNAILAEAKDKYWDERINDYSKGYNRGYTRALDLVEFKIKNELRFNDVHKSVDEEEK